MNPKGVTPDDVLEALRAYYLDKGYCPSVRELGDMVGLSSSSSVQHHLQTLVETGRIVRDKSRPRAIRLIGETE